METQAKRDAIMRNVFDIPEERGVCGFRRRVITEEDTDVANVTYLRIDDSKYHYHKTMTEFYYVISGGGTVTLDGETRPVRTGRPGDGAAGRAPHFGRGDGRAYRGCSSAGNRRRAFRLADGLTGLS